MRRIILLLAIPFVLVFQEVCSQNAPVTTIGNVISYGSTAIVPVTVTGFAEIGSCELILNFDPSVMEISSVTLGPGVTSYYFLDGVVSSGTYKISWLFFQPGVPGLTLSDNSVFLNINVQKATDGYSAITFNNSSTGNCFYTDFNFDILPDNPKSTYFIDGSVTFLSNTQWTGTVSDDWSDGANWSGESPSEFRNANIPSVNPNYDPVINGAVVCRELNLGVGATLTINTSATLTAKGDFNNDGHLIIHSSSTGYGSFIDNGTITGSGTATIERYLVEDHWHYVSPPVSNAYSGAFYNIYLKEFLEDIGEWNYLIPEDILLNPMQGYATWASSSYTGSVSVYFEGDLNFGLQNSANLTNTPGFSTSGYNFVGNPYPSSIDWDATAGWTKTNLDNAIYIWSPNHGNYGSYINGNEVNNVTSFISPCQGFFVHVTEGESSGSLAVDTEARVHGSQEFLKSKTNSELQSIKLSTYSNINEFSDEAAIIFNEDATLDFDSQYDAYKLSGLEEAPELYSITTGMKKLAVNTLPNQDDDFVVPLGFKVGVDAIYTIESVETNNLTDVSEIVLEDTKDEVFVDLKEQAVYNFFASVNDNPARFNLHFKFGPSSVDEDMENHEVHMYSFNNKVIVESVNDASLAGLLNVYQIDGRLYQSAKLAEKSKYEIEINHPGMYIVEFINDEQKSYRRKLYIH